MSASSTVRFVQQFETDGSVALKPRGRHKRRLDAFDDDILDWNKQTPDITLDEICQRLAEVHSIRAPTSTIDDWLRAQNISFKINRTCQ